MISLSGEITQELRAEGFPANAILEWPNGVDLSRFDWAQRTLAREPNLLVTATRLSPEKANDVLLRAFRIVVDCIPDARLLILGEGVERNSLERLAEQLGIARSVEFAGHVPDVAEKLAKATLFVLPSRHGEGMSNALLEAMAAGCACLASDIIANREVLANGAGALFTSEDAENLGHQAVELLRDLERLSELRTRARQVATEHYGIDAVAERYVNLYQRLMEECADAGERR